MLDPVKVGEFIAKLRKDRGLTQSALADLLCVTHQAVSKWENGAALPDIEVLVAMKKVFGVSVDDILNGEVSSPETAGAASGDPPGEHRGESTSSNPSGEKLIIEGSQVFDSSISVDQCQILGEARFKADLTARDVAVMGGGSFCASINTNTFAVMGSANVGSRIQADAVNVWGMLSCGSDMLCGKFENHGKTNCGGQVTCDSLNNSGSINIGSKVTTDGFFNSGAMNIGAELTADAIENQGKVVIGGGVITDSIKNNGALVVSGDLTTDSADLSGQFDIGGTLTADRVGITLTESDCHVHVIKADSITVTSRGDGKGVLETDLIEVDSADLTNVRAKLVKINTGRIGEGCKIDGLQCGPDVEISGTAQVGWTKYEH